MMKYGQGTLFLVGFPKDDVPNWVASKKHKNLWLPGNQLPFQFLHCNCFCLANKLECIKPLQDPALLGWANSRICDTNPRLIGYRKYLYQYFDKIDAMKRSIGWELTDYCNKHKSGWFNDDFCRYNKMDLPLDWKNEEKWRRGPWNKHSDFGSVGWGRHVCPCV